MFLISNPFKLLEGFFICLSPENILNILHKIKITKTMDICEERNEFIFLDFSQSNIWSSR